METTRSADGTAIAYDRSGDGPPLILVVGAFCDRSAPATLAAVLAQRFTVYAYDRRGRGDSGAGGDGYSPDREVDDLAALLTVAGGSALVFGHSSGAVLALEAAARGLPISKLAAYEPPYIMDGDRSRPVDLAGRVGELISSDRRGAAAKLFLAEGPQMPPEAVAMMESDPSWAHLTAIAHTLPYDLALCGDQRIPDRVAKIAVPTLLLAGAESPAWARNSVAALAAEIPDARVRLLDGQNHAAADDVLAPVLMEFFAS